LISVPTLALAGSNDAKFSREAEAIASGVENGALHLVEGAGHAAHLERPEPTARAIASFLLNE
jgi:pimeloyl-ACP methyl ester carboxylesterase